MTVTVRVPAKVNLGLRSGGRDESGYHPLSTVFHAVSIYDEVTAAWCEDGSENSRESSAIKASTGISIEVTGDYAHLVPQDRSNLAVRAVELLAKETGTRYGIALRIHKEIPVAGGMAGGSADAAAALVAADALWGTGLNQTRLLELAGAIGSDVPFALVGCTAIGTGRGHLVTPVPARGEYHWVFATQAQGLSTPDVFAVFDELNPNAGGQPESDQQLLRALRLGDAAALGRVLSNDLQPAALRLAPHLADTLAVARKAGALGVIVSGAGPTVAALARSEQHAAAVADRIAQAAVADEVLIAHGPVVGAQIVA
jgi:4-diphosphocytidyl-2-C-methyl-D-erythritol kinase